MHILHAHRRDRDRSGGDGRRWSERSAWRGDWKLAAGHTRHSALQAAQEATAEAEFQAEAVLI